MPATSPPAAVPLGSFRDVPNQITAARLVVTVACFVCVTFDWHAAALAAFLLAAGTDWADGFWARRWGPITRLGRVLDPFADKLLICGVFTLLAAIPGSRIAPWVAVVVLSRELLVTALRSFVEAAGGDFSAKWVGKWKMVLQCAAAALSLLILARGPENAPAGLRLLTDLSVWGGVVLAAWSGLGYIFAAVAMTRDAEGTGEPR